MSGMPDAAPARDLFGEAAIGEVEAKIGRPAGSVNRNSLEMRRLREALGYRPGIIALAELGSGASLDELIERALRIKQRLGCKADKAIEIVFKAVAEYAAYDSAKVQADRPAGAEPPESRDHHRLGRPGAGARTAARHHDRRRLRTREKQGLSAPQPRASDTDVSDTES